jgi:transcriptional regulator with XRE-family HTH domain
MARRKSLGSRLGVRLRARRQALNWSQATLAEKANISPNYVGMLERGEQLPSLDTLLILAKKLNVSVADLLDDTVIADDWLDEVAAVAASIPVERRAMALAVLRTIAGQPVRS